MQNPNRSALNRVGGLVGKLVHRGWQSRLVARTCKMRRLKPLP
ncbi:hypothetical protein GECvBN5_gp101c [Salmonella phage GEC_vB_N5]|uniref:Uncharacterized protein n=3 Tax=Markadamsvirinae TaxID=2732013 RepID=A0A7S9SSR2_9CAUD|nr:hypothetical protein GECvBN3_gp104c [Salmonella phage GEC_vB_N3]QPI15117.1 hypothetical protein GECvBN5_gp101c [Salmonella phage GEC_vB_N5]QPI15546.1 hypothetical protein GECvBN7_gp103c [Salmonella phage GEC_vB_N7]